MTEKAPPKAERWHWLHAPLRGRKIAETVQFTERLVYIIESSERFDLPEGVPRNWVQVERMPTEEAMRQFVSFWREAERLLQAFARNPTRNFQPVYANPLNEIWHMVNEIKKDPHGNDDRFYLLQDAFSLQRRFRQFKQTLSEL